MTGSSTPQDRVPARDRETRNGEPFAAAHPPPPPSARCSNVGSGLRPGSPHHHPSELHAVERDASRRRRADSPRDGCRSPRPRRRWSCAAAAGSAKSQAQTSSQGEAAHVLRDVELRDVARRRDPVAYGEVRAAVHRRDHRLEALALQVVLETPVADEPAPARLRADLARDAPRGRAIDVRLLRVRRREQPAEREGERQPDRPRRAARDASWRRERAAAARAAPPAARPPRSRASSRRTRRPAAPPARAAGSDPAPRRRSARARRSATTARRPPRRRRRRARHRRPRTPRAATAPPPAAPRRPPPCRAAGRAATRPAPRSPRASAPGRAPDREEQRGAVVDRHRSQLVPELPGLEAAADHDVGRAEEVHEAVTRVRVGSPGAPGEQRRRQHAEQAATRGAGRAARRPRRAAAPSRSPRTW